MTLVGALAQVARWWLIACALVCAGPGRAQLPVPPVSAHVSDQTATLSAAQQAALEQTLAALEARKGSQLAVLIVPTTAPEPIEQYALRVAEVWKLGRKKIDDGAIVVLAKNDRAVRIEVGYGLEGALNDATSKRIIDEIMLPRFRQQDYFGGLSAGIGQMIRVIDGEALPPPPAKGTSGGLDSIAQYAPVVIVAALVIGGILRSILGKVMGAVTTAGIVGVLGWLALGSLATALLAGIVALWVVLLGPGILGRSAYYGGGHGGHGGLGGLGGGGFHGGGGGFGGGGASGRW